MLIEKIAIATRAILIMASPLASERGQKKGMAFGTVLAARGLRESSSSKLKTNRVEKRKRSKR
jgi:hypothetical protein